MQIILRIVENQHKKFADEYIAKKANNRESIIDTINYLLLYFDAEIELKEDGKDDLLLVKRVG